MTIWTAAVIIAVIWGIVTMWSRRHDRDLGVTRDEDGNPVFAPRATQDTSAAEAEIAQLKERLAVLERIATDANSGDARERARIASEIEALRAPDTAPLPKPDSQPATKDPSASASSDA